MGLGDTRVPSAIGRYNPAVEIDLFELPIPDWGLCCPRCEYWLKGLPSHRCPECGLDLDIPSIVQSWHRLREPRFTGEELPFPDFGLVCGVCGQPLAGAAERTCPSCGRAFDAPASRPGKAWFVPDEVLRGYMLPQSMAALLAHEYVPYIIQEGPTHGMQPYDRLLLVASEFYFDVLWLLRREAELTASRSEAGQQTDWSCPSCGEENPHSFEVCWNCNTAREKGHA